jgi:hypothetical protein
MVLSCWSAAFLGRGRVGGCGVAGWWVPGRAGDVWPVVERGRRTPVWFLCGCSCGAWPVRSYPPRRALRRRFAVVGLQGPEADGRGSPVAGAGGLAGFLDGIAVVSGAFDRAGAAAVAAFGIGPVRDLGQDRG